MAFQNIRRGFHYQSLSFRLFALILLAVIPGLMASIYVGFEYREREISRIQEDTLSLVRLAADDQEEILKRGTPTLLRLLSSIYPEVKSQDGPRVSILFSHILKEYPQYINIMAADAVTGNVFASGLPQAKPLNLADRPYFSQALKNRGYVIGEFALGRATGKPTMTCAIPVFTQNSAKSSIIAVGIDIERMAKQAYLAQPNKDVEITLLDRNGTIILNSSKHEKWVGKSVANADLWHLIRNKNDEGKYYGPNFSGVLSYIAYKPLLGASGRGDGYVLASINADTALVMADRFLIQNITGLLIGTVLALLGGLIIGHRSILRNVNSLVNTAEKLAKGDLGIKTEYPGKTEEFKRISNAFNAMSIKLLQREEAQKKAEKELFDEKEQLMVTLGSIGDGVITTDTGGKVVLINKMAEKLTGWKQEDAEGKPLTEVFHIINEKTRATCANPVEKVLLTGETIQLANHTLLITKDGMELIISDSGAPIRGRDNRIIGVVLVFRDITEKRQMEDEIIKTERLESLSLLAGGIAHDFNNLLTAILGNINLAALETRPESGMMDLLKKAERAGIRARDLTSQLLSFTTGGIIQKKTVAVDELIMETARFVLSGSNVTCDFNLPGNLRPVEIDKGQFTQVINNLIINSLQAMPGGGKITISGENCFIAQNSQIPLAPKHYIKLTLEDQGCGIPEENLEKIFDPYFTTKRSGVGLGLASSYYIIKRHEGHITVDSKQGAGASFCIYLPSSDKDILTDENKTADFSGKGRILVMDDEEMVRDIARAILVHLGFTVDFAENGGEAIKQYKAAADSGNHYAAVIMDLTIPGAMGGIEATEILLKFDPSARIFASSGYSNDAAMMDFKEYGFCGVIPKPYMIDEMRKALKEALIVNE